MRCIWSLAQRAMAPLSELVVNQQSLNMAFFSGYTPSQRFYLNYHLINLISPQSATPLYRYACYIFPAVTGNRCLSGSAESTPSEFRGPNAYDLLGVSETSSFAEIKASFHKLAKETHPDLAKPDSDSSTSKQFIQILAAYEILSDSVKRAHYDQYLLSQRILSQRHSRQGSIVYAYESHNASVQMEVVEWLRWYRSAITDILSEKRVVVGSGYFDVLERDFYSAIHKAYYGPEIDVFDLLPEYFEAEERSQCGTSEVLHLVSGRDLFGVVRVVSKTPELSQSYKEKLTSFASDLCRPVYVADRSKKNTDVASDGSCQKQKVASEHNASDAYKDLELHVGGRLVAMATRVPAKGYINQIHNVDSQDCISVFLMSHENQMGVSQGLWKDAYGDFPVGTRFLLGTITGLGSNPEEGSCCVYDNCGVNTHTIMKHRTLLVKHMHWYRIGDKVSICECRCTRARLPPSKFWLFEPRCGTHDIGGWYVETFGRDKKGWTVPSQRSWDGLDASYQFDKRLHPAMYLLTLAYRTLDIEDARRNKKIAIDIIEAKMSRILSWCKKFL